MKNWIFERTALIISLMSLAISIAALVYALMVWDARMVFDPMHEYEPGGFHLPACEADHRRTVI